MYCSAWLSIWSFLFMAASPWSRADEPVPAPGVSAAPSGKPKYGPAATPLRHSPGYFRRAQAPDFWALISNYVPQFNGKAASVASVAMVLNAMRSATVSLTASDELAVQEKLLKKVNDPRWFEVIAAGAKGGNLGELKGFVEKSFEAYGISVKAEIIYVEDSSTKTVRKIERALRENEKSARDFLVANYLQSEFTDDPEGAVGHISPVGAYDGAAKKVLVMDVDRDWYEPYWVSLETFVKGLNTEDATAKKHRGLLRVSLTGKAR